ncbi:hypothetical protein TWF225_001613 [Orbilia oligospora]|uniref:Uncharacterized protein n=1 Tax=Orbilia oligospora TaxID=2813651 RepID=A0A7C8NZP7_ORBOL|nr:hypothetical protein TWF751_004887 [Orbilia oligospora]KAF3164625.1 hypothetical protein TWF225_001613 [Orbilia oligospora]KAF3237083.1 hypothetical protein TWF217_002210 [Orbilia oligospora]KAF3256728.1 hypothetical protein TWF128_005237 [Orbilia oligospora]KAF3292015.1 hypothetical protein TWF132_006261 [Orbilia oligospora]
MNGGVVAEIPQNFLGNTPSELHAEIFKHLPSEELVGNIQAFPFIQDELLNWNMSSLTAGQLVYFHGFLETGTLALPPSTVNTLKQNIITVLPKAFQKFTDYVLEGHPLEPSFFNCYFDDISTTMEEIKECKTADAKKEPVTRFLEKFDKRNTIVRKFCTAVKTADPNGKMCRYGKVETPEQETWFIHLLFWLATDYVHKNRKGSAPLSEETIASLWSEFLFRVGILFGPEVGASLKDCVLPQGILLLKYRDYIVECSSSLPTVYNCLKTMAFKNQYVSIEDYATFILVNGLDRAYGLLQEDKNAIEFIAQPRTEREVFSWRNLWRNFEDEWDAEGSAS